ncbi:MAG: ABC transporter ATP-binding protein [Actinomycetota bacterium]
MALLEVADIKVRYGAIEAVAGVSFHVDEGEIVTLIGGNGAGKTTTLKAVSGLLPLAGGTISFRGEDLRDLQAHEVVSRGITQVPEGRKIFSRMTVKENLQMGAYLRSDSEGLAADLQRVLDLFPVLKQRLGQAGGTLSGGEQQMLAIGRGLMSRPDLLMMDEPSMGLAPIVVERIFETIQEINRSGTTVLLVEQNAHMALGVASRGYVVETGRILLTESAEALSRNEQVRKAYLGEN